MDSHRPDAVAWLGHSTVVLDLAGSRVITDPLLRSDAPPLRRRFPAPPEALWRGTQAVLLSHLHHDHAELSSLRMLGDVPIFTAAENAAWVTGKGLRGEVLQHAWTDLTATPGVSARLTSAVHRHRPMPHRPNAANGQLLRTADRRIYVVGDTALFPGMAQIPERLGGELDLIVVPIGGWGPRLSPGHLGPAEAAQVCAITGAKHALAVHWGTLHPPMFDRARAGWLDAPLGQFVAAVAEQAPGCAVVELRPGQHWEFPS